MSVKLFLVLLFMVSVLTSLVVEALKKMFGDRFSPNIMAGVVSVAVGIVVGIFYIIVAGISVNATVIVYLIALVLLGWLCAMLGYDKVVQAIKQINERRM